MPAWNAALTDKQIAQVLTYVRTKLGGNAATPITEKEMDTPARLTVAHSDSWSEAELLAIPAADAAAPGTRGCARRRCQPVPTVTAGGNNKPAAANLGQGPGAAGRPRNLDKTPLFPVIAMSTFAPRHSSWPGRQSAMTPTLFRSIPPSSSDACPPFAALSRGRGVCGP